MPNSLSFSRKMFSATALALMLVIFMTGLAGALRQPTLSVFLHNEITPDPLLIGVFYSVNSFVAMVLSQIVAHYSDRYPNRKRIILYSCVLQVAGCLLFAFNRDYYVLLSLGTLITGLGASASSQLFAFSREYSEQQAYDTTMFNSLLRAQLSLAWIIGPPLAYHFSGQFGFKMMYCAAALVFVLSMLIVAFGLPQAVRKPEKFANAPNDRLQPQSTTRAVWLLALSCLLVWMCNSMMFINLPLYLTEELHLDADLAGILMGTAAGLEIPVMLLAGYATRTVSKKTMMIIAILAALIYNLGLVWASESWQLLALQLFNGVFVGILASIGMVYFQDLMPNRMGAATTLFNNVGSASWIVSGYVAGQLASHFGYHSTWWVSAMLCVASLIAILPVQKR